MYIKKPVNQCLATLTEAEQGSQELLIIKKKHIVIEKPEYMKELLRKYMDGTATPIEKARMMVAWDIYDDEEISDMIAELTGEYKEWELDLLESSIPEPTLYTSPSWVHKLITPIGIVVLLALVIGSIAVLSIDTKRK